MGGKRRIRNDSSSACIRGATKETCDETQQIRSEYCVMRTGGGGGGEAMEAAAAISLSEKEIKLGNFQ